MELNKNVLTIAFTGHRPDKLGGYGYYKVKEIKEVIYNEVLKLITIQTEIVNFHFISGGALGTDQMAFIAVENMRILTETNIINEIAIPFQNQWLKWTCCQEDVSRYFRQIEMADKVTYVDKLREYKVPDTAVNQYHIAKMQKRNEYIVDRCDILIAVWNGIEEGGTWNCIKYARKLNKKIIYINPNNI